MGLAIGSAKATKASVVIQGCHIDPLGRLRFQQTWLKSLDRLGRLPYNYLTKDNHSSDLAQGGCVVLFGEKPPEIPIPAQV